MKSSTLFTTAGFVVLGLGTLLMLTTGCQTQRASVRYAAATTGNAQSDALRRNKSQRGGAELWTENCLPCHNVRSPSVYSDADWEIVMHHMRVRANLRASDHQRIAEFLRSAN